MTTVTSRMLHVGAFSLIPGGPDEPHLYGHVARRGLFRVSWSVTEDARGPVIARGRTWTKGGARTSAIAATVRGGR